MTSEELLRELARVIFEMDLAYEVERELWDELPNECGPSSPELIRWADWKSTMDELRAYLPTPTPDDAPRQERMEWMD